MNNHEKRAYLKYAAYQMGKEAGARELITKMLEKMKGVGSSIKNFEPFKELGRRTVGKGISGSIEQPLADIKNYIPQIQAEASAALKRLLEQGSSDLARASIKGGLGIGGGIAGATMLPYGVYKGINAMTEEPDSEIVKAIRALKE